ncbi:hypothetical protein [Nocardia sp. CNY236]|uniref:hypothetical protein n=1 Tax=Nocardia sp. CNY236 TaxID=1169152 RepID=UPI00048C4AC6|nr:hypothetical protein [Nocardia sp. CNY236]
MTIALAGGSAAAVTESPEPAIAATQIYDTGTSSSGSAGLSLWDVLELLLDIVSGCWPGMVC